MHTIKITSVGNSAGVVLSKEILAKMKVEKGDTLFAVETPEGLLLTPYDPEVEIQLQAGRDVMREYRDTLRALSKR
jgi:putative addiction module antidote